MAEYIEKAALMGLIESEARRWGDDYDWRQYLADIEDFKPTDVRPVVRCKDCRYSRKPDRHSMAENAVVEGVLICFVGYDHVYPSISNDVFVCGEHFCGYGEVRDG